MKMFKTFTVALLILSTAVVAQAETWAIDTAHSVLDFKVRHLFSKTGGQFGEWEGMITFDGKDLTGGSVELTIQAASIDTRNEDRDNHLRSADFFDVETYPTLTFKSTEVVKTDSGFEVRGDLTMHGVTKGIAIPFEYHGSGTDPWGTLRAGFSGSTTVNRKDFGIVWNKNVDKGGLLLGDDVAIDIEIEAIKVEAEGR